MNKSSVSGQSSTGGEIGGSSALSNRFLFTFRLFEAELDGWVVFFLVMGVDRVEAFFVIFAAGGLRFLGPCLDPQFHEIH